MNNDFSFEFLESKESKDIIKMIDQVKQEILRMKIAIRLKKSSEEVFDTSSFSRSRVKISRMFTILSLRKKKKNIIK
ncbi:MAG: hypothetical protein OEY79_01205 [Anaplasmataceae bacterium]|nr:hypothetical protein [Anaplasmataceae bacterium]